MTPVDLDKAERMIDKMIADGSLQKQANKLAEQLEQRMQRIRDMEEQLEKKKETDAEKRQKALSLAQKEASKAIKNYIDFMGKDREPLATFATKVFNLFDNIGSMKWDYPYMSVEILDILRDQDVIEGFEKSKRSGYLNELTDILKQLIQFCIDLSTDELSTAIVQYGEYDAYGHTTEECLIIQAEYESKLRFEQEKEGILKAHKEAHS